jgi:hypothetical protein
LNCAGSTIGATRRKPVETWPLGYCVGKKSIPSSACGWRRTLRKL